MKKLLISAAVCFVALVFTGCGNVKDLVYFQGIDSLDLSPSRQLYDAKIMPKDQLTILVTTSEPEASRPFRLYNSANGNDINMTATSNNSLYSYLVDNNGDINFPTLGFIHVAGLTTRECEAMIHDKVAPYLSKTENPVFTVRLSSFRVTIIGESGPQVVSVPSESMSVIEAIASAGDISVYGKRDNILLIRQDEYGEKHAHRFNIADASILNSPLYYVQQNDIIYVEPNKQKLVNTAFNNYVGAWLGAGTTVVSAIALVVALSK